MKKSELINLLNNEFVFSNQENWDKCGVNQNYIDNDVNNVLVALDITQSSIDFAIKNHVDVIITHHPLFIDEDFFDEEHFSVNLNNNIINTNRLMYQKLIKHDILHICLHTCFDRYKYSNSYNILLNTNLDFKKIYQLDNNPYILVGELNKPYLVSKIAAKLKTNKLFTNIRYLKNQANNIVNTIAVGGGSCSSFINNVIDNNKIDCFLTGDIKWHTFLDAYNCGLNIIDINHNAENVFIDYLYKFIINNTTIYNCLVLLNDITIIDL